MGEAKARSEGYKCPVRGCPSKDSKRFTLGGVFMHIRDIHGQQEIEKRLRLGDQYERRK